MHPWILHLARREAWLAIIAPTWPRGYLRLLGAAGIVEGLFLMLMDTQVPILAVALPCLVAGVLVFALTFVRRRVH